MPAAGVPASVAVPLPLFVNVTPEGSPPVSTSAADGKPVVVTVKEPGAPCAIVVLFERVIAGAWLTVSVNDCCAGVVPFDAVNVSG